MIIELDLNVVSPFVGTNIASLRRYDLVARAHVDTRGDRAYRATAVRRSDGASLVGPWAASLEEAFVALRWERPVAEFAAREFAFA